MLVKATAPAGMDIEGEERGRILKGQQTDRDPMHMKNRTSMSFIRKLPTTTLRRH